MKHIWSVLCQKSLIDDESKLLSLINCIEELNLSVDKSKILKNDKLIIPFEFQVVSFWIVEKIDKDNTLEVKIELLDPNKKLLNHFENKQNVKAGILRVRNRAVINGIPITINGRYIIKVYQKNVGKENYELVAELPIDIKINYKPLNVEKK